MGKAIDLTGQKFERLIAIRPTEKRNGSNSIIWECRCDCGNTVFASAYTLRRGDKKSCGCLKEEQQKQFVKKKKRDLTGQRFDRLVAIRPTEKRSGNGAIMWECRCKCGNTVMVRSTSLIHGETRSCGCLKNEMLVERTKLNLTGQRFGRLVVIRETEDRRDGNIIWECRCDCGNTFFASAKDLSSENSVSCGCVREENRVRQIELFKQKARVDSVDGTRLSLLNDTKFKHNTSGIRGVCWNKNAGKWVAAITFKKHNYYLGLYASKEQAAMARKIAEEELWKPFLEEQIGGFVDEKERKEKVNQYLMEKIKNQINDQ